MEAVIVALIMNSGMVLVAWLNLRKHQNKTHTLINSRMDELLKAARREGFAEGQKADDDKMKGK